MRLLAGWLCLSLASVWLARRMWTLRSPLTRSLYVNMTSGPGGPAAAAGGRKENHQVARKRLNVCVFTRSISETAQN
uniref:Methyltransferase 9, His-X-His N1(pi)-histidine n=1 Tax=Microcebus murinus TaxID=30608 RepID=A0A8C5W538_MICMU